MQVGCNDYKDKLLDKTHVFRTLTYGGKHDTPVLKDPIFDLFKQISLVRN